MGLKRAYLIYPFSMHETSLVKKFKDRLAKSYEIIDPFDVVGLGSEPKIAEKDMKLIKKCDLLIAFLPVEGTRDDVSQTSLLISPA